MLVDPKSQNLVTNFADQWLYLRNLSSITPDLRLFPDFDENLRDAFRRETTLFVQSVFAEDRNVLDLLRADYTFLNERRPNTMTFRMCTEVILGGSHCAPKPSWRVAAAGKHFGR